MADLIPTAFTKWSLSEEEEKQGSIYTITQIQVLQNQLAAIAEEKIALELDPNQFDKYLQREAGLAGQMAIIQHLLDQSEFHQLPPEPPVVDPI